MFLFSNLINIFLLAALIPPIAMMVMVYRQDKIEREPAGLIVRLFLFGCLSALPAVILETIAGTLISALFGNSPYMLYLLVSNFIGVALIEEGCKYFFLKRQTWDNPEFNYRFDAVVYAVAVSMGFAAVENVIYVFSYGLGTALLRALLSIPLHCICGIYMGHYYGEAKLGDVRGIPGSMSRNIRLAILVPVLLHGFYDFAASAGSVLFTIIFAIFVIVVDITAIRNIRTFESEDMALYQDQGFDHWR